MSDAMRWSPVTGFTSQRRIPPSEDGELRELLNNVFFGDDTEIEEIIVRTTDGRVYGAAVAGCWYVIEADAVVDFAIERVHDAALPGSVPIAEAA